MFRSMLSRAALVAVVLFPLAACDDGGTGLDVGETRVLLSRGEVVAPTLARSLVSEALAAPIPLSAVASIDVVITSIQLLPAAGEEEDEGDWITVALDGTDAVAVDLLDLPVEGGIPVGAVELAGQTAFAGMRLFFEEPATITLDEPVQAGPGTLEAGPYPVFIPSAAQTGIKVLNPFTLAGEEDIVVNFDVGASVRNIVVAGATGRIILPPVIGVETDEDI